MKDSLRGRIGQWSVRWADRIGWLAYARRDVVDGYLSTLTEAPSYSVHRPQNQIFCFMPSAGGAGSTTIAVNFAIELARIRCGRVLLADLDITNGSVGFNLRMRPELNSVDALSMISMSPSDWGRMVVCNKGVDFLLLPGSMNRNIDSATSPTNLLNYCRDHYDVTVVDCGGWWGSFNAEIARQSNEIVVVTTADLRYLYSARIALGYLQTSLGIRNASYRAILNRHTPRNLIGTDDVEMLLGVPVHTFSSDPEEVDRSVVEGKPLRVGTHIHNCLQKLTRHLMTPASTAFVIGEKTELSSLRARLDIA
jgi:pilus assembly protein CpaE